MSAHLISSQQASVRLVARMMFAAVFLPSGMGKLLSFDATAGFIASRGLPFAGLMAAGAVVVELVGSAALLAGWRTRWAALTLLAFTLLAALLFHDFWAAPAAQAMLQRQAFLKNVGIAGGLLLLAAVGAGRISLDHHRENANSHLS